MSLPKKKHYTEAERLELAAKLDRELDEYINGLEKTPYTEGWPEDKWEEEMEKHPFFMTKVPDGGSELNPLYEGLQQLKYDAEENTPEELATSYKQDGNYNFKYKNYRLAVLSYTEGLKTKCGNKEIEATLYNNRSAANYFLKNYRSSLRDCKSALKLKPFYDKVLIRAAHCCYEIGNCKEAVEYCDEVLMQKDNKEIFELRKKCVTASKKKERDSRLREKEEQRKSKEQDAVLKAIGESGVHVSAAEVGALKWFELVPDLPQLREYPVHLGENGRLIWPVVFLYFEYKIMDFIQEFCVDETFADHFESMFESPPEWDADKKYKPADVSVYLKDHDANRVYAIAPTKTLGEVLKLDECVVQSGTPAFVLVIRDSEAERQFVSEHA